MFGNRNVLSGVMEMSRIGYLHADVKYDALQIMTQAFSLTYLFNIAGQKTFLSTKWEMLNSATLDRE